MSERHNWFTLRPLGVHWHIYLVALFVGAQSHSAHNSDVVRLFTWRMSEGKAETLGGVNRPNLAEVNPTLYRGGQPTAAGLQILAKMGISTVIDARGGSREGEREQVTKLGMQYVAIPWHCPFPEDKVFARFLLVIRQNRGRKIFVHCRLGDDRVGMMIAAYRMAEEAWTAEEAMQEMKAYGFTASHHLICPCLAHYEKSFPRRFQSNPEFRALH